MRNKYYFLKRHLTPFFWLSWLALFLLVTVYKYFNLDLQSLRGIKGPRMLVLVIVCFTAVVFFHELIVGFKNWSGSKQLLLRTGALVAEFFFKILPFFVFIYIYDSLHDITYLINSREFDWLLIKLDRWLLFGSDISLLMEKIINPGLTAWLSVAYVSYFVFYLVNPIVYFFARERKIFDLVLLTVIIANFLGIVLYILVPCVGPVLAQQELFSRELLMPSGEPYQSSGDLAATYVYSRGSFHCFPSLHFGVTFIWLYFAFKYLRQSKYLRYLYYLHWPIILSLWLATLYLRWHYLVDWLGGLIVALTAIWLAKKLNQAGWEKNHETIV